MRTIAIDECARSDYPGGVLQDADRESHEHTEDHARERVPDIPGAVRVEIVRLKELRKRIDEAIHALASRSIVVTGPRTRRIPEPIAPPPRIITRPRITRDRQANEHTLHLIAERGDRGVTIPMVARTFRITKKAAKKRLQRLVATGLVVTFDGITWRGVAPVERKP